MTSHKIHNHLLFQEFKNHYTPLFAFAKKLTQNEFDAKDLIQDTYLSIYRGQHTFQNNLGFKQWSFTILKNIYLKRTIKSKRFSSIAPDRFSFIAPSINNKGIQNLSVSEIEHQIDELSPKTKKPFTLFLKGYKYKEISQQLLIPIGTVKSRINSAKSKLREKLDSLQVT